VFFYTVTKILKAVFKRLIALGYKPPQAIRVINAVYKDEISSEALIREALRAMV
jgi:Holliday junction DNA helicase RuvA